MMASEEESVYTAEAIWMAEASMHEWYGPNAAIKKVGRIDPLGSAHDGHIEQMSWKVLVILPDSREAAVGVFMYLATKRFYSYEAIAPSKAPLFNWE